MSGLKTLKDFLSEYPDEGEFVLSENIRQEAIKWIKLIRNLEYPTIINGEPMIDIDDWIKQFFNITEEELK